MLKPKDITFNQRYEFGKEMGLFKKRVKNKEGYLRGDENSEGGIVIEKEGRGP